MSLDHDLYSNNLPAATIAEIAVRLVESAGGTNYDYGYFVKRAGRGWCAAEIARAYVRSQYGKGNPTRRRLLVCLTKFGAKRI